MNTNLNDYVKIYDRVLTKKQCDILINLFDTCENKEIHNTEYYKFQQVNLNRNMNHFENILNILVDVFSFHFEMYRKELNINHLPKEFNCFEQFRIKKYEIGDYFNEHIDANNIHNAKRYLSGFIYLNDSGGTVFFGKEIEPNIGSLVIFPPLWLFPHHGVVGNKPKYFLSTYLHYSPE